MAAQHYLDHDGCLAETLRAPGYPCRETLAAWVDELHPETRKRVVGNLPLLSKQEKTRLVEALRNAYTLPALFDALGFARSSYFYHRARLRGAGKYADARLAITDIFELNSPLLRLSRRYEQQ